jgi:hypothetical protein
VPASIAVLLPEPVDHLIGNDRTSVSERAKPQKDLLGGLQNIIIDVMRGSHASDDRASKRVINNIIQRYRLFVLAALLSALFAFFALFCGYFSSPPRLAVFA